MKIPIAKEGLPLIKLSLILCIVFYILGSIHSLFYVFFILSCLSFFLFIIFFRDPERKINYNEEFILSPADGYVFDIVDNNSNEKVVKIFMSIFDVHVQRSPVSGVVNSIVYKPGKFLNAKNSEADMKNEQNIIGIKYENTDMYIYIKQIAGVIARRIICRVKEGDRIRQGERIGIIKFGSQVDLIIPSNVILCIEKGEKVKGGVTIMGKIR